MRMIAFAFIGVILFSFSVRPAAQSNHESKAGPAGPLSVTPADGEHVTVSGIVRRVGTDPFSELIITDADETDWYITAGDRGLFDRLENRRVVVTGTLKLRRMILADGRELSPRRELYGIEVLEIDIR